MIGGCSSTDKAQRKSSASPTVSTVLETAHDLEGTPYKYAGSTPDGFDCSGYTTFCFAKAGIKLPRTSRSQYTIGSPISDTDLRPGDLVFFNTSGKSVSHVGIYVGSGKFIHASTSRGVMVSKLSDRYWAPRYVGARRVIKS